MGVVSGSNLDMHADLIKEKNLGKTNLTEHPPVLQI